MTGKTKIRCHGNLANKMACAVYPEFLCSGSQYSNLKTDYFVLNYPPKLQEQFPPGTRCT